MPEIPNTTASADDELAKMDITTLPQEEALKIIGRVLAAKKEKAVKAVASSSAMDTLLRDHRNKIVSGEKRGKYKRDAV